MSNHYAIVHFTTPMPAGALNAGNYEIARAGSGLEVMEAERDSDSTVMLITAPQEAVEYNLTFASAQTVSMMGSTQNEPGLDTAVSLNSESVLLTFSERMDSASTECVGTDCTRYYRIIASDGGDPAQDVGGVEVVEAMLESDGLTVVLTTTPQELIEYEVKVTNVEADAGGARIDPTRNTARFFGIDPVDTCPPEITEATATTSTTVLVSFSEPVGNGAGDPGSYAVESCPLLCNNANGGIDGIGSCINDSNCGGEAGACQPEPPCQDVLVVAAEPNEFGTQVLLTTLPLTAGANIRHTVTATGIEDLSGNAIDCADCHGEDDCPSDMDPDVRRAASFTFAGDPGSIGGDQLPRVVGAASTGNTGVIVQFSKPMGNSAESAGNYVIVQQNVNPEAGALLVVDAQFASDDRLAVQLTTRSQNELTYELTVVNVKDLAGNPLAPRLVSNGVLVDPTRATFPGTPPSCVPRFCDNGSDGMGDGLCASDDDCDDDAPCDEDEADCAGACVDPCPDADDDGLSDSEEQRGWVVVVELANGDTSEREVTSDPDLADTDGDGLDDRLEKLLGTNPRDPDTDDDGLSDYDEYNVIFSEPTAQDTDGDGLTDDLEVEFHKTNALVADSDGDGFTDAQELFDLNRDPRIADLPRQGITVESVTLRIDERFTFTDEQGETVTELSNTSTTLGLVTNSAINSTDSRTTTIMVEGQARGGASDQAKDIKFLQGQLTVAVGGEFSSSITRESARQAERALEISKEKGLELSKGAAVTREIIGASIEANVTLENLSGVAFSSTNVEISILATDPQDRSRYLPIATLIPNSTLITGEPAVFNLGPLEPTRGPIIFADRDVFPNLAQDLMRDPRGLLFRVANVDITDEFERNFAFASQIARDRTTGLVVDFGDGSVERYLVSTAAVREHRCNGGTRDGELCRSDDDCPMGGSCEPGEIRGGHAGFSGTGRIAGPNVDFVLQDILGLRKNSTIPDGILAGPDRSVRTFAQGDDVQIVPAGVDGVPEDTIAIIAGLNGVLDTVPEGDDVAAVVTGYATTTTCGPDTPSVILLGADGIADTPIDPASDDVQLIDVGDPAPTPGTEVVVGPGANGIIDSIEQGDDVFVAPGTLCSIDADCHTGTCNGPEALLRFKNRTVGQTGRTWTLIVPDLPADIQVGDDRISTDFGSLQMAPGETIGFAFVRDRDRDGVIAQEEFLFNSSDNDQDTDNDGLDDFAEIRVGWEINLPGSPLRRVFPDPSRADSDADGLLDGEEMDLRGTVNPVDFGRDPDEPFATDPRAADTDDDLVDDVDEVFGYLIGAAIVEPSGGLAPLGRMILAGPDGIAQTIACNGARSCSAGDRSGEVCRTNRDCPATAASQESGVFFEDCTGSFCDDIQVVPVGTRQLHRRTVVITAGPDGMYQTNFIAAADDVLPMPQNGVANSAAVGDDNQTVPLGASVNPFDVIVRPGFNGLIDTVPTIDDVILLGRKYVFTDPLNRDFDGDDVRDGFERRFGTDPTDPSDGRDFVDTDDDALTDAEESRVGWTVDVTALGGVQSSRSVFSNPNVGDTDFDGLPDFLERYLGTDPTSEDTDDDTLGDFDEVSADVFLDFADLEEQFSGFVLDGGRSLALGTDPLSQDTDGDGLADDAELDGYVIVLPGTGEATLVPTDPRVCDTDFDGLSDGVERQLGTDARVADTDGDGRTDGVECCAETMLSICTATCEAPDPSQPSDFDTCRNAMGGSDPRRADIRVTVNISRVTATAGTIGGEWWWGVWVRRSTDAFPGELVSTPTKASTAGGGCVHTGAEDLGFDPECNWCAQADLFNVPLLNSTSFTLLPGQGFSVHGAVAEMAFALDGSPRCLRMLANTPRLGINGLEGDADQCSMSVPVTSFTYEELASAGFLTRTLEFEKGTSNNDVGCQGNLLIEIQVE